MQNKGTEGREREADGWGLLTEGTHATERQGAEASSAAGDLIDGEVSAKTEGINVFLSSRRTY